MVSDSYPTFMVRDAPEMGRGWPKRPVLFMAPRVTQLNCTPMWALDSPSISRRNLSNFTSWQIGGESPETMREFILGAPKSLHMVTAAMKLKDACSLEEKL